VPPQTLYAAFRAVGQRGLVAGIHNEIDEMVLAEVVGENLTRRPDQASAEDRQATRSMPGSRRSITA
jgi:hypothetical protein